MDPYLPPEVMQPMVATHTQQHTVVDVGAALHGPERDVVNVAARHDLAAARAALVTNRDRDSLGGGKAPGSAAKVERQPSSAHHCWHHGHVHGESAQGLEARSEERRVGKGCRATRAGE